MREHFRGVIWDRDPVQGPKGLVYRYPIVGLICTDFNAELPPGGILVCRNGSRFNDGSCPGIIEALSHVGRHKAPYTLGDANCILTGLDRLIPDVAPRSRS